jgi:hypothetical protein
VFTVESQTGGIVAFFRMEFDTIKILVLGDSRVVLPSHRSDLLG